VIDSERHINKGSEKMGEECAGLGGEAWRIRGISRESISTDY